MKKILQTGKKVFDTATAKALSEFESGMKVVMEVSLNLIMKPGDN